MHLTRLALTDFRSYVDVDVPLKPGVTIFSGPNGEGKTNLVEAVGYAATLASHRAAQDAPLIRKGADQAIIRAAISTSANDALVEIELNAGRANRVRLNRTPLTRPRDVLGVLRTVLFAPEDLALVKGDPGERRRFLDDLLVAMAPRYAAVRADYDRVLKQRTALLKSAGPKGGPKGNRQSREAVTATLDVWDAHLARTGAELLVAREHLVAALRPYVENSYAAVAGDGRGPAAIEYRRSFEGQAPDEGRARPTGNGCAPRSRHSGKPCSKSARASSTAASASRARTATSLSSASAASPRAATPATASPGRSRSRSASPASTCSGPAARTRCSSSTTCSPSSTRAAGTAWPPWSRKPSRSWSPPPSRKISPASSPAPTSGSAAGTLTEAAADAPDARAGPRRARHCARAALRRAIAEPRAPRQRPGAAAAVADAP